MSHRNAGRLSLPVLREKPGTGGQLSGWPPSLWSSAKHQFDFRVHLCNRKQRGKSSMNNSDTTNFLFAQTHYLCNRIHEEFRIFVTLKVFDIPAQTFDSRPSRLTDVRLRPEAQRVLRYFRELRPTSCTNFPPYVSRLTFVVVSLIESEQYLLRFRTCFQQVRIQRKRVRYVKNLLQHFSR